ncbi:hypothetical protein C4553_01485 [Candidatus Parcubacteria bacterium]|nr:MAG: hypothetical protein C4553_01485 [Candidatus Parcubacteria bacterium]
MLRLNSQLFLTSNERGEVLRFADYNFDKFFKAESGFFAPLIEEIKRDCIGISELWPSAEVPASERLGLTLRLADSAELKLLAEKLEKLPPELKPTWEDNLQLLLWTELLVQKLFRQTLLKS